MTSPLLRRAATIAALAAPASAVAQDVVQQDGVRLKVMLVQSRPASAADDSVRSIMSELATELQRAPGFPYRSREIDYRPSDYNTSCAEVRSGAVATLQPLVFVRCRKELGEANLIPLFLVRKEHEEKPYYHGYFIAAKNSPIESVHDTAMIRQVYLNHERSLSGYIGAIDALAEAKAIPEPSLAAVKRTYRNVETPLGRPWDVLDAVRNDPTAIGASGSKDTTVKVLQTYGPFPQDVVVISADLRPYQSIIENWFEQLVRPVLAGERNPRASVLATSGRRITGLNRFDRVEHGNAFALESDRFDRVAGAKSGGGWWDDPIPSMDKVAAFFTSATGMFSSVGTFVAMIFVGTRRGRELLGGVVRRKRRDSGNGG